MGVRWSLRKEQKDFQLVVHHLLIIKMLLTISSLAILATTTFACGPLSGATGGTSFCATQLCSHIYNFQTCGHWNSAECTCSSSDATCPGGYTMDSDGTKCYIVRKGQSSWSDAATRCTNEGDLRLAVITTANQNTAVQTAITQQASGKAFIGLTDSASEGTWVWSDGSSYSYNPGWVSNHPTTNTAQNCVVMRDSGNNVGKWQHVDCSKSINDNINFVCERKTECGYNNNIGWAGKK